MPVKKRKIGEVLVVEFEDAKMLDEAGIIEVGDELAAAVDECDGKKMLLDFSAVSFMSSSMIGKIVFLDKDCKKKGVDLRICSIAPSIMEVFNLMHLNKVLKIHKNPDEGLHGFGRI